MGELELIHQSLFYAIDVAEVRVLEFEVVYGSLGKQTRYFCVVFIEVQEKEFFFS
jgi:hypothetical protein